MNFSLNCASVNCVGVARVFFEIASSAFGLLAMTEERSCAHAISLTANRHTNTIVIALYMMLYLDLCSINILINYSMYM